MLVATLCFYNSDLLADSLCSKDETTYFSCKINSSIKTASLCGRYPSNMFDDIVDLDAADQDAYINQRTFLTYRFGTMQKIELKYPQKQKGSFKLFEGVALHSYFGDIHEVYFNSGNYSYAVSFSEGENGSHSDIRVYAKGSIDGDAIKTYDCEKGTTTENLWNLINMLSNFGSLVVRHPANVYH